MIAALSIRRFLGGDAFIRSAKDAHAYSRGRDYLIYQRVNSKHARRTFLSTVHGVQHVPRDRYQKMPSRSIQRDVCVCVCVCVSVSWKSGDRVWDRDVAGCQPGISQAPTFCHGRDPLNRAVANDNRATAHFTRVFM